MVGIFPSLVCHGQYWLVYLPFFSVADNIGWYINRFCLSKNGLYQPVLSVMNNNGWIYVFVLSVMNNTGWYITGFCLSWTYWLVHLQVFSVMDNIGW